MITRSNFPELLISLGFTPTNKIYYKTINGYELKVDFANEKLIYPEGIRYGRETTVNFSQAENFVVFECVHNLLQSGYKPEHIILEQGMPGGHGDTGGFCDIIVQDNDGVEYLLIECKTADDGKSREFSKAWAKMFKKWWTIILTILILTAEPNGFVYIVQIFAMINWNPFII